MPKNKYYVVWKGIQPGIYHSWTDCKKQIDGFEGAMYKSFESAEVAHEAYQDNPWNYMGKNNKLSVKRLTKKGLITNSLAVDAACSGNPGDMEYRGVDVASGQQVFHAGPFSMSTNNIGEFLAIVHGLAYLKQHKKDIPIYSDSQNAISWVNKKKCKTQLNCNQENQVIFDLIERAEKWLHTNSYQTKILKWETQQWGENPADFGRK